MLKLRRRAVDDVSQSQAIHAGPVTNETSQEHHVEDPKVVDVGIVWLTLFELGVVAKTNDGKNGR